MKNLSATREKRFPAKKTGNLSNSGRKKPKIVFLSVKRVMRNRRHTRGLKATRTPRTRRMLRQDLGELGSFHPGLIFPLKAGNFVLPTGAVSGLVKHQNNLIEPIGKDRLLLLSRFSRVRLCATPQGQERYVFSCFFFPGVYGTSVNTATCSCCRVFFCSRLYSKLAAFRLSQKMHESSSPE